MSHKQLTQEQRYHLYEMNKMSLLQKDMATVLGVHPSTISRELKKNVGKRGEYIKGSHKLTLARRKNKSKRRISDECWQLVEDRLRQDHSPEQVSIRCNYLNQPSPKVLNGFINTLLMTSYKEEVCIRIYAVKRKTESAMEVLVIAAISAIE